MNGKAQARLAWPYLLFIAVAVFFATSNLKAYDVEEEETEYGYMCTLHNNGYGTIHWPGTATGCGGAFWANINGCCSGTGPGWQGFVYTWSDESYEDPGWSFVCCHLSGGRTYGVCECNKFGDNCSYRPIIPDPLE